MLEGFARFRDSLSDVTQGVSAICGLMGAVGGAFAIPSALQNVPTWQSFIHSQSFTVLELINALVHGVPVAVCPVILGAGGAWILSAGITEGVVRGVQRCSESGRCCRRRNLEADDEDVELQIIDRDALLDRVPAVLNSRQVILQRALTQENTSLMESDLAQDASIIRNEL